MTEVLVRIEAEVARVSLNRPERRNALNDALLDQLASALEGLAADPSVRVVVVTGVGGHFSVGADLGELAGEPFSDGDRDAQIARLVVQSRASLLLRELPKVTVVGIDGACAGAGMGLAMAADLRMISPRAVFKTAFVTAGMSGDFGLSWTLSRLLGDSTARRLLLEDPRIGAERAVELGLASRITAEVDTFAAELQAWAEQLAGLPPLAVAGIKANLDDAGLGFADALKAESPRHIDCARSDDALEAARAFVEKRKGRYTGR